MSLSDLKWFAPLPKKKKCSPFNTMISVLMNTAFRQSPEPWNEAARKLYKGQADPIPNNLFRYHISCYTISVPYFQVLYTRHNVVKLSSMAANALQQLGKITGLKLSQRLWKFRFRETWVKYLLHTDWCCCGWYRYTHHTASHTRKRNFQLTERFASIKYELILAVRQI